MPPDANERRPRAESGAQDITRGDGDTAIVAASAVALLELSDERDWHLRRLLAAERAAWLAGYEAGNRDGYEYGCRQMEAAWPAIAARAQGPSLAELELRRWGPGGRQRFGDRRPGDFPGRGTA